MSERERERGRDVGRASSDERARRRCTRRRRAARERPSSTSICDPSTTGARVSWSTTASGIPSGSDAPEAVAVARIVSATSWPTVRSPGGSGGGSSRVARRPPRAVRAARRRSASSASSNCHVRAVGLADLVRDARAPRARERRRARAARSTAKPSIASTSQPLEPPTRALVPIGRTRASGSARARGVDAGPHRQARAVRSSAGRRRRSRGLRCRRRAPGSRTSRPPAMPTWRRRPAAALGQSAGGARPLPRRDRRRRRAWRRRRRRGAPRRVAATTRIAAPPYPRRARLVVLMGDGFSGRAQLGTPMSADTISVNVEQDRAVVALRASTRPTPRDKLAHHLAALLTERIDVAVDLRRALFIDSTVVGVLMAANKRCAGGGGRLHARGRRRDRLAGAAPARG